METVVLSLLVVDFQAKKLAYIQTYLFTGSTIFWHFDYVLILTVFGSTSATRRASLPQTNHLDFNIGPTH